MDGRLVELRTTHYLTMTFVSESIVIRPRFAWVLGIDELNCCCIAREMNEGQS